MTDNTTSPIRNAGNRLRIHVVVLATMISVIWLLELADVFLFGQALNALGVLPRQMIGLRGILFMPLLHGGLGHVAANTVPLVLLGWLVMMRRVSDFVTVTVITMTVTGVSLWLVGNSRAIYIGASGLIFGYFGFLLLRGWFERSFYAILVALIVALVYGGLIWGVLPQAPGISWQAHLFGFMGGVLAARLLARKERLERGQLRPDSSG